MVNTNTLHTLDRAKTNYWEMVTSYSHTQDQAEEGTVIDTIGTNNLN